MSPCDATLDRNNHHTIALDGNYSMAGISIDTANPKAISGNITLKGRSSNDSSLVFVSGSGSSLTMKAGAKITGNTNSSIISGGRGTEAGSASLNPLYRRIMVYNPAGLVL
ncbi:MAG: hypothetical protein LBL43_02220 [Treponema sp.]|nr:hypothetical protein [Treponema sp.]